MRISLRGRRDVCAGLCAAQGQLRNSAGCVTCQAIHTVIERHGLRASTRASTSDFAPRLRASTSRLDFAPRLAPRLRARWVKLGRPCCLLSALRFPLPPRSAPPAPLSLGAYHLARPAPAAPLPPRHHVDVATDRADHEPAPADGAVPGPGRSRRRQADGRRGRDGAASARGRGCARDATPAWPPTRTAALPRTQTPRSDSPRDATPFAQARPPPCTARRGRTSLISTRSTRASTRSSAPCRATGRSRRRTRSSWETTSVRPRPAHPPPPPTPQPARPPASPHARLPLCGRRHGDVHRDGGADAPVPGNLLDRKLSWGFLARCRPGGPDVGRRWRTPYGLVP